MAEETKKKEAPKKVVKKKDTVTVVAKSSFTLPVVKEGKVLGNIYLTAGKNEVDPAKLELAKKDKRIEKLFKDEFLKEEK